MKHDEAAGRDRRILEALGLVVAMALVFYAVTWFGFGVTAVWYLPVNLALGLIPVLLTYPLLQSARRHGWGHGATPVWFLAWLAFLPNSFYLVTDYAHLFAHGYGLDPLFGVVLFGMFAAAGMAAGLTSLWFVHRALAARLKRRGAEVVVTVVILLSSIAIYWGHTLRWNSWDPLLHPVAVAQDVASGTAAPTPEAFLTVVTFFVLIGGLYAAVWRVLGSGGRSGA